MFDLDASKYEQTTSTNMVFRPTYHCCIVLCIFSYDVSRYNMNEKINSGLIIRVKVKHLNQRLM